MKLTRILVALLLAYVALVVVFETFLGVAQPAGGSTMVVTTTAPDGTTNERVVARLESAGQLYVAANHWPRAWYRQALQNPTVRVVGSDFAADYRPIPIAGAEYDRVNGEHPLGFAIRFLTGFPARRILRLDPADVPPPPPEGADAAADVSLRVGAPTMPHIVEGACPGEGCMYGTWIACDTVPLFAQPGDASPGGSTLLPAQQFEVVTGVVVVDSATVVVVRAPTRQSPNRVNALTFDVGDTLHVLDYLGEGFFNAWHADSVLSVAAFWGGTPYVNGPGTGDVLREGASSFWVQTMDDAGALAWIHVDAASVAAPNALDPDPAMCRAD